MKVIAIVILLPFALFNFNCSGSKKTSKNAEQTSVANANNAGEHNSNKENSSVSKNENKVSENNNSTSQEKKLFRFTVSFISKGAGIDFQMRQKYDAFINDFETRNKTKIIVNKASWGREGEIDYCIEFTDLKKEVIESFISESKAVLNTSDRINIGENTRCRGVIK